MGVRGFAGYSFAFLMVSKSGLMVIESDRLLLQTPMVCSGWMRKVVSIEFRRCRLACSSWSSFNWYSSRLCAGGVVGDTGERGMTFGQRWLLGSGVVASRADDRRIYSLCIQEVRIGRSSVQVTCRAAIRVAKPPPERSISHSHNSPLVTKEANAMQYRSRLRRCRA